MRVSHHRFLLPAFALLLSNMFANVSLAACPDKPWTTPHKFVSRDEMLKKANFANSKALTATNPTDAQKECSNSCWAMGEPAPCGWYTVIQWMDGNKMTYECNMVNARSLKGIYNPVLPNDANQGAGGASLFFKNSWTYTCNENRSVQLPPAPAKKKK